MQGIGDYSLNGDEDAGKGEKKKNKKKEVLKFDKKYTGLDLEKYCRMLL